MMANEYLAYQLSGPTAQGIADTVLAEIAKNQGAISSIGSLSLETVSDEWLERIGILIGYPRPLTPLGIWDDDSFAYGQFPVTQSSLSAVASDSNNRVCAVGFSGTIIYSDDGGLTWNTATSGVATNLFSVSWYLGLGWCAVGIDGKILTSPDAEVWTLQVSGVGEWLFSVTGSTVGWVSVGENGTILTSANGSTWVKRTSGTTATLKTVSFDGVSSWMAVGENSTVVLSSDGASWLVQSVSGLAAPLPSGACRTPTGWWVVVDYYGYVSRSLDGVTWANYRRTGDSFRGLSCGPSGELLAISNQRSLLSYDSGLTWALFTETASYYANSGCFTFSGDIVVVCDEGVTVSSASLTDTTGYDVGLYTAVTGLSNKMPVEKYRQALYQFAFLKYNGVSLVSIDRLAFVFGNTYSLFVGDIGYFRYSDTSSVEPSDSEGYGTGGYSADISAHPDSDVYISYRTNIGAGNAWLLQNIFDKVTTAPKVFVTIGAW